MIVTTLEFIPRQIAMSASMQKALDFLNSADLAGLQPGRIEIDGQAVYALVQAYETLPISASVKFEAHRRYIDIQYIASGEEVMGWADLQALQDVTAYNAEKDVLHGTLPAGEMIPVRVMTGQAAIFWPEDAHAPKLAVGSPAPVKKVVVKVRVTPVQG
jgi:biofilm protein TabA